MTQEVIKKNEDALASEITNFGLSNNCVIFNFYENKLNVLLLKRSEEPFFDEWALPGDLVLPDEDILLSVDKTVKSVLGNANYTAKQFHTFGSIQRHPLGRVATVAFLVFTKEISIQDMTATDSVKFSELLWIDINNSVKLCFDHNQILEEAREHLGVLAQRQYILWELLPENFTILQAYTLFTILVGKEIDKSNFRRKLINNNLIKPINQWESDGVKRPAQLFTLNT